MIELTVNLNLKKFKKTVGGEPSKFIKTLDNLNISTFCGRVFFSK